MIVECRLQDLTSLLGKKLTLEEIEDTLFMLKAELEKVEGNTLFIEINPDRQDMLSVEGIARALKGYLGIEPGLTKYSVRKSGKEIIVERGLKKVREFIACGIVKGVEIDDELVKEYMHLQEHLTATHGRNRRKASIGLYVHDDIDYPVIYCVEKPEKISFVPLGYEEEMTAPEIIREHEKGILYGPIISHHKKWPLLKDAKGEVLSLPPIINSNTLGRITLDTENIFVEVTGTHRPTAEQALNIMVASLVERGGVIQSVKVTYPDGEVYETPDLKPEKWSVTLDEIKELIGIDITGEECVRALERMGYGAKALKSGKVNVLVPAYRTDILHGVDIIEDVAIGYGFENIEPTLPITTTTGKLSSLTRLKYKVRDLMVGIGYQEVLSYIMSSPEVLNMKMLRNEPLVVTGNPKTRDYSVLRDSLIPILIDFVSKNQHADYPQKVFEVGDVALPNESAETRIDQVSRVCGLTANPSVNLTELMTELGFLLRNLGLDNRFEFKKSDIPSFIKGRSGEVIVDSENVGIFGEVAPEVLTNFEMTAPIVTFEISINSDWI